MAVLDSPTGGGDTVCSVVWRAVQACCAVLSTVIVLSFTGDGGGTGCILQQQQRGNDETDVTAAGP